LGATSAAYRTVFTAERAETAEIITEKAGEASPQTDKFISRQAAKGAEFFIFSVILYWTLAFWARSDDFSRLQAEKSD
jgi:hypothetical protein